MKRKERDPGDVAKILVDYPDLERLRRELESLKLEVHADGDGECVFKV